jgi:hypothetical protein
LRKCADACNEPEPDDCSVAEALVSCETAQEAKAIAGDLARFPRKT